jgi:hypothetical protein
MAGLNVVTCDGTLKAGPPKASTSGFPTGVVNTSFSLRPAQKLASVSTQAVRNLATGAGVYATLHGIGTGEDVTQGTFLYVRTDSDFLIRITTDDGSGGSVVAVLPVSGLLIFEAQPGKFIKLLEASGSGVVEYYASGTL